MDESAAPDRDTSCFLLHVGRSGAGAGMAEEPAGRRPAGDRHRSRHRAVRLADRHAALPSARRGLWEVRSSLPSRRIARLLFFVHEGRIGVVHGFIKKTQKTPADDLEFARRRMKEMQA